MKTVQVKHVITLLDEKNEENNCCRIKRFQFNIQQNLFHVSQLFSILFFLLFLFNTFFYCSAEIKMNFNCGTLKSRKFLSQLIFSRLFRLVVALHSFIHIEKKI